MSARLDVDVQHLSSEQQAVYERILSGPRGLVQGPLRVWLTSPALADHAQALGAFCRYGTTLPRRLSELAILVMGAHWKAGFEWAVHAPIALAEGLDPVAVEALRLGVPPAFKRVDEQAVHRFADELLTKKTISEATYGSLIQEVGEIGVVELVGVLGYYSLISMTIKAFGIPASGDGPSPFEGPHR